MRTFLLWAGLIAFVLTAIVGPFEKLGRAVLPYSTLTVIGCFSLLGLLAWLRNRHLDFSTFTDVETVLGTILLRDTSICIGPDMAFERQVCTIGELPSQTCKVMLSERRYADGSEILRIRLDCGDIRPDESPGADPEILNVLIESSTLIIADSAAKSQGPCGKKLLRQIRAAETNAPADDTFRMLIVDESNVPRGLVIYPPAGNQEYEVRVTRAPNSVVIEMELA